MSIRVFLVDDEELLIESMEIILTVKGKMEIAGIAKDGREALQKLEAVTADIALVDLNMKGMGGLELIPIMKERYPEMKVLVLTTFYDDLYITKAISGGADAYLLKDSSGDMIIKAIHQVIDGQSILAGKVLEALSKMMVKQTDAVKQNAQEKIKSKNSINNDITNDYSEPAGKQKTSPCLPQDLTTRELELCALLAKGCTNTEIAAELFLAEGTVKNYMISIYDKFGIHDRSALVLCLNKMLN